MGGELRVRIDFDPLRFESQGTMFPKELWDDCFVFFHGTSDSRAACIEASGFAWNPDLISQNDVAQLIGVYERMNWCGVRGGGLAILSSYSHGHDFRDGAESPVYFAESDSRAILYASRDFAGGEKARAARIAISELKDYLTNQQVRDEHSRMMAQKAASGDCLRFNPLTHAIEQYEWKPVDLEWLGGELKKLEDLRLRCVSCFDQFRHGVIYAVRFEPMDFLNMEYSGSMGLKLKGTLPPERIAARIDVPSDYQWDQMELSSNSLAMMRKLRVTEFLGRLLPRLKDAIQIAVTTPESGMASPDTKPSAS